MAKHRTNYACETCGKRFRQKGHLRDHIRVHTGERPFVCKVCDKTFTQRGHHKEHERSHFSPNNDQKSLGKTYYQCDICPKVLSSAREKTLHIRRIHSRERPYDCEFCDKSYADSKALGRHMNKHSKKLCCEVCGMTFACQSNLRVHENIHVGIKDFHCQFCGKAFTRKENLNLHLRRHTKETQFKCEICGAVRVQACELRDHMMTVHSDERPFTCLLCGKGFIKKYLVELHVKTSHREIRQPVTEMQMNGGVAGSATTSIPVSESGSGEQMTEDRVVDFMLSPPNQVLKSSPLPVVIKEEVCEY